MIQFKDKSKYTDRSGEDVYMMEAASQTGHTASADTIENRKRKVGGADKNNTNTEKGKKAIPETEK